jgi:glycosyltransferase involved in cell wall biosynthesis
MKVVFFANRMPDLCGAFLHDVDLATEFQKRGHQAVFLIIQKPKEGYQLSSYRGFPFMHFTAGSSYLDSSDVWICPHAPVLPDVRKLNSRGYNRPIVATCHYDGNYTTIVRNFSTSWKEMLLFINQTMEPNYRKKITPWPSNIVKTDVVRPILHQEKILIEGEQGPRNMITLVNANHNKGVMQFIEIAKQNPTRKFLGVLPYYGELYVPDAPPNVEWTPFDDDIRNILKRTRILLMPSYYESFGRIAVESMLNGIPVLYSKPQLKSKFPGGSTEGVQEWIGTAGISCDRETISEWSDAIASLDDEEAYADRSAQVMEHIGEMHLFEEASRIAGVIEVFAREHPVVIRTAAQQSQQSEQQRGLTSAVPREPPRNSNFSLARGLLKIRR